MRPTFLLCIAMPLIMSFKSMESKYASQPPLVINFADYVGAEPLVFDSVSYTNELGQSYTISAFRYHICHISFVRADGSEYATGNQFLIDAADEATTHIKLYGVPEGAYTSIRFTIGADSVHSHTDSIFMQLDGKSSASKAPGHIFEFHIGGNKASGNYTRTVNLHFPYPMIVENCKSSELTIKADVAKIMKTPHTIDLSRLYSTANHHNTAAVADNYADMFSIAGIH